MTAAQDALQVLASIIESVKADYADETPNMQAAMVVDEFITRVEFDALTSDELDAKLEAALGA